MKFDRFFTYDDSARCCCFGTTTAHIPIGAGVKTLTHKWSDCLLCVRVFLC